MTTTPATGALLLALGACAASTQLTSTWSAPDAQAPLQYRKILVVFQSPEMSRRLSAEVRMKQRIPNAVSSNTVFEKGEERDMERVKAKVRERGFDAVVIMRPVALDKNAQYVPPSVTTVYGAGPGMYGYWNTGWATVYDPGYYKETTMATVETELYQVDGEKLIWISRSRTMNPKDVPSAIDEIIDANAAAMRKQGLLKKPA